MSASARAPREASVALPPIPFRHRIYGFGSVYGKTLRDSRLSFIVAAGLLGGMALAMAAGVTSIFPTPASRLEVDKLIGSMPAAMVNLFGRPEMLGTLGGYMSWKYGAMFALGTALWSIMALSGTLAGEAGRGALDLVATAPFGKRRLALEKVAAHLTVLILTLAVLALGCVVGSGAFGDASLGDTIAPLSAVGFALWVGFIAVFFGGLALALGPLLGRAGAAGVSGLVMVVLWVANGLDVLGPVAALSPFRWTTHHVALVGEFDWTGLLMVGVVAVVFLAIGVELFTRRDLGVTLGLRLPGLPAWILGVRGPVSRAFGEQLLRAASWGVGLGLMGALVASLVGPMTRQLASDSNLLATFAAIFPGFDLASAGGFLQLYLQLLLIAAGFGAATLVAAWASDETDGRLEMVLTTPTSRVRWVVAGGAAAILGVVTMTALFAAGIGLGAASGGVPAGSAIVGSVVLGLYAAAVVGVGFAVGGLWRSSAAAQAAALFVVGTYLLDLLVPPLGLPGWVRDLALTSHLGQPMVGTWDWVGMATCVAIAAGGIALGAWGMARRDVTR
jgi:ABC-2 type transport system permease protein